MVNNYYYLSSLERLFGSKTEICISWFLRRCHLQKDSSRGIARILLSNFDLEWEKVFIINFWYIIYSFLIGYHICCCEKGTLFKTMHKEYFEIEHLNQNSIHSINCHFLYFPIYTLKLRIFYQQLKLKESYSFEFKFCSPVKVVVALSNLSIPVIYYL